jgi:MFS family permease
MADATEKTTSPEVAAESHPAPTSAPTPGETIPRPAGWMYKGFHIGGTEYWYASPEIQLFMVAFVCFLCPGMFNALGGIGGGGQIDQTTNDDANVALYSTFAVVAFFSGTIANRLGIKPALALGGLGYCIYAASFLSYSFNENLGFVVFAGAFLGLCAGLLWTGQGCIMMSYPSEQYKGRYIAWFWIIFNTGAVLGSLISLGQNAHKTSGAVTTGTYVAFIVLMFLGACLALCLCNAKSILRHDGSKVILMKNPSWSSEFIGLYQTFRDQPWVVLLFPMFFASNIFYTYQQNDMNGSFFNIRARTLNGLLYWLAQIFGAVIFGYCLDFGKLRRTTRARVSFGVLFAITMAIWGGGWAWQKQQLTRAEVKQETNDNTMFLVDWTDGGKEYIGPMFLYFFYGFYDAAWQTCIYWYMGAISNSGRKATNLAGFYKGIQSAGSVVFWRLDSLGVAFNTMFGVTWGILGGALLVASPVILFYIKDTVSIEEDLKFSDETIEDVAGAAKLEKSVDV